MTPEAQQLDVPEQAPRGRRLLFALLAFGAIVAVLAVGLKLNPREIPSPLIGKAVPEFSLPPVRGRTLGLASADLKGEVSIVNVFASWCVSCKEEHPVFMQMKREGLVPVHGLNYKDRPEDAERWLADMGDPYTRTGADIDGRVAIDWGVYGVPETFVIDRAGRIAYKHIGPVTPKLLDETLRPMIAKLHSPSENELATAAPAPRTSVLRIHDAPRPLPDFGFEDGEARKRTLSQFRGKVVLLNVWATWCAPCREEMPALDRVQQKLGRPGFQVLALSIDAEGAPAVKRFYGEIGVRSLAVYVDPTMRAAVALGALGVPTTLLIDGRGLEIGRHTGPAQWDSPDAVRIIEGYLKQG